VERVVTFFSASATRESDCGRVAVLITTFLINAIGQDVDALEDLGGIRSQ
jgi:hypothetical protein